MSEDNKNKLPVWVIFYETGYCSDREVSLVGIFDEKEYANEIINTQRSKEPDNHYFMATCYRNAVFNKDNDIDIWQDNIAKRIHREKEDYMEEGQDEWIPSSELDKTD